MFFLAKSREKIYLSDASPSSGNQKTDRKWKVETKIRTRKRNQQKILKNYYPSIWSVVVVVVFYFQRNIFSPTALMALSR